MGKDCKLDKGVLNDPFSFGSTEQLKHIQKSLLQGCSLIGVLYQPSSNVYKLLVLDLAERKMMRYTQTNDGSGQNPTWEGWSGFTKEQVLNDDPGDGFDLPNYKSGRGNKVSTSIHSKNISKMMMELVKARK